MMTRVFQKAEDDVTVRALDWTKFFARFSPPLAINGAATYSVLAVEPAGNSLTDLVVERVAETSNYSFFRLRAGKLDVTYTVECKINTSDGQTYARSTKWKVVSAIFV